MVEVLLKVATAPLAQNIGVVCRWTYRDGLCSSSIKVAQVVSDSLKLICSELHLIKYDHVMRGFCLSHHQQHHLQGLESKYRSTDRALQTSMRLEKEIKTFLHSHTSVDDSAILGISLFGHIGVVLLGGIESRVMSFPNNDDGDLRVWFGPVDPTRFPDADQLIR